MLATQPAFEPVKIEFDPALNLSAVNPAFTDVETATVLSVESGAARVSIAGVVIGVTVTGEETAGAEVETWLRSKAL